MSGARIFVWRNLLHFMAGDLQNISVMQIQILLKTQLFIDVLLFVQQAP
jgi:hypothetical protein